MGNDTLSYINGIALSSLYASYNKKIIIPVDFQSRSILLQQMNEDSSGLVKTLGNFIVQAASVEYKIVSENKNYNYILDKWLQELINADYNGLVPRGINALAEEYVKERILGSSFPVLKITQWKTVDGIQLPAKMFFVDGGSIVAKKKTNDTTLSLGSYDYFLGEGTDEEPLINNIIMQKCYARWYAQYPNIFMFDRGIYRNHALIKLLKDKQGEILTEIIPLITLIKKSTEALMAAALAGEGGKAYNDTELVAIKEKIEKDVQDKKLNALLTSLFRVTNADEDWKHIIPDITPLFKSELSAFAEKGILAGFGFLELTQVLQSNRKDSVLNPVAFVREIKDCVKDFREKFLKELFYQVQAKNVNIHKKWGNVSAKVTNSPVKDFIDNDFKILAKNLWDKGLLSGTTMLSLGIDTDIEVESDLRTTEDESGTTELLKPRPALYQDLVATPTNTPKQKTEDVNGKPINPDKQGNDKQNFVQASDEFEMIQVSAPYKTVQELPPEVKKLPSKYRKMWREIFNSAYSYKVGKGVDTKKAESYAFAVAWAQVNKAREKEDKK